VAKQVVRFPDLPADTLFDIAIGKVDPNCEFEQLYIWQLRQFTLTLQEAERRGIVSVSLKTLAKVFGSHADRFIASGWRKVRKPEGVFFEHS